MKIVFCSTYLLSLATGIVPVSDSGTVNGAGRYNGGPAVPWSVVNVVRGKRYRLRIINESARNVFTLSVDGHKLTVSRLTRAINGQNSFFGADNRGRRRCYGSTDCGYRRSSIRSAL